MCINPKPSLATYAGSQWPSNDWSIGRAAVPKSDDKEHPLVGVFKDKSGYHRNIARTESEWHPDAALETAYRMMDLADACGDDPLRSQHLAQAALEMAAHAENGTQPLGNQRNYLQEAGAPGSLGLSAVINSEHRRKKPGRIAGKPAAGRGTGGITTYGKRMSKSCVSVLAKRHSRFCLTFGTTTIPPLSLDEMRLVCLNWSKIVNLFVKKLSAWLKRRGLDGDYILVTEIQPKRWECWGQVVPHLHILFQGRCHRWKPWALSPSEFARMWGETLENFLGHPVDASAATRVEVPKKNVARELGKYMSKGGAVVKQIAEAGKGDELPTAWWGASKALKREVKSKIERFSSQEAEWLLDNAEQLRSMKLISFRHIYVVLSLDENTGVVDRRWMGMAGYFVSDCARQKVMSWCRHGVNLPEQIATVVA